MNKEIENKLGARLSKLFPHLNLNIGTGKTTLFVRADAIRRFWHEPCHAAMMRCPYPQSAEEWLAAEEKAIKVIRAYFE